MIQIRYKEIPGPDEDWEETGDVEDAPIADSEEGDGSF